MLPEHEKLCAAYVLRLLLDGEAATAAKPCEVSWDDVLRLASRNTVLVRLAERLENRNVRPPESFVAAVAETRRLNQAKLELASRVARACEGRGITFIMAKAFHDYPDMGGDVDLFVPGRSEEVDAVVLEDLSATPHTRSPSDRLAASRCYSVAGCEARLDIHHGRMWAYGEHHSFIAALIENARRVRLGGAEFSVPSPEDLLVVQATQRVYGRSSIRLAPILHTITSLRRDELDWKYVLTTARRFNAFLGLSCYLSYVEQIHREVCGGPLLPAEVRASLITEGWGRIEFRGGAYRFPSMRVARKVYLNMFRAAMLSGNWKSLSRLCLAPFVAATVVFRKSVSQ